MIGIKQKLRYSEMLAARNYLKILIDEILNDKKKTRETYKEFNILNQMLIDLDELFIKQISFIENEIDINYPEK
jgi:hypothetical protein